MKKLSSIAIAITLTSFLGMANQTNAQITDFPPPEPASITDFPPTEPSLLRPESVPNEPPISISTTNILATAQDLAKQLKQSYTECQCSAQIGPRRFTRNPGTGTCNTPQCLRLKELIETTKQFLNGLNGAEADAVSSILNSSIW
jgi:hypothetical protein